MKIAKTRIYKSFSGWQGLSLTEADANGEAWQISTYKTRAGVSCNATKGRVENGIFSYDMFGSKKMELYSEPGQCTEKKVATVHTAGLSVFAEKMKQEPTTPTYVLGVGQVIFTDFVSHEQNRRVIYEVITPGHFKTVTLDGKELTRDDRVRPYTEKFGIGVYYNEGETLPIEKVGELVQQAKEYTQQQQERERIAAEQAQADRLQKIEIGKKIVPSIPPGAVCVIQAECRQDDSDIQSDYHAYSTTQTVYLSYSSHRRDLFPELRKAAGKFEPTKIYSLAPEKPADADEWWRPSDEHREKYSMGSGYYLGDSKYSGWIVSKCMYCDGDHAAKALELFQIAAAEGRYFCSPDDLTKPQAEHEKPAPVQVPAGKIQFIDYSAASFAVVGETKPIKDILKQLGGSFNFRLSCGPGWIFSKKKLDAVKAALLATKQPQKSAACSEVLQEMDTQQEPDYSAAVAKVLTLHPTVNRADLETELQAFI